PGTSGKLGELRVRELTEGARGVSEYPLGITVIPGDHLELMFGYHPELYDPVRIEEIKAMFVEIIEEIAAGASA
ncbi:MAG TPA: hypothetical protein VHN14_08740, partial [Kofleriaceae bacterium]|nr:hypothetical protein [Kofleriaceae bacterium]